MIHFKTGKQQSGAFYENLHVIKPTDSHGRLLISVIEMPVNNNSNINNPETRQRNLC